MALYFTGPEPGQWIVDALDAEGPAGRDLVAGQVPRGFEAYARIFHPALDLDGTLVPWAAIARERGTLMHGEAQFASISGISDDGSALVEDAWDGDNPTSEGLPAPELAAAARILATHTATPERIHLGLWNGFAFIHGGDAVTVLVDRDPDLSVEEQAAEEARQNAEAKRPGFADAIRHGALLELGDAYRAFYLFEGDAADLAAPAWASGSLGDERRSPNLAWPWDKAWMLSSEIYEDSTIVGGSIELVRALVACPELEAHAVNADSRLDVHGDTLNSSPDQAGY
ncbi:hypothetical protein [Paeniglutamicibacter cryotolerans]|uniref:Uncharacterized protein n=1 Tax=Paeniglutamicibacter cryotolerans TaxID=670079 RepID=A0A839QLA9_9MICC|nr:hypothetical protein [Paeniglutamicibacter cryotolerans]MBB2996590.1 hypothetical protein [Paeniglutamicibacter cryotolerans]